MPGKLDVNEQETTESSKSVNHEGSQWKQVSVASQWCSLHAYYSIQLFYGRDHYGLPYRELFLYTKLCLGCQWALKFALEVKVPATFT